MESDPGQTPALADRDGRPLLLSRHFSKQHTPMGEPVVERIDRNTLVEPMRV
jgi:hypothetical protein